jgi:hypothetical protein
MLKCSSVLLCKYCSAHGTLELRMKQIAEAMGLSEHDVAVLRLAIRHGLDDPCQPFEVTNTTLHCSDVHASIICINTHTSHCCCGHKFQYFSTVVLYFVWILRLDVHLKLPVAVHVIVQLPHSCCTIVMHPLVALCEEQASVSGYSMHFAHCFCCMHAASGVIYFQALMLSLLLLLLLLLPLALLLLPLLLLLPQSRSKVSGNNLVRFKTGYVPPEGLKFSMDFNVNGNVDTRDSILAAAAGSGSADADDDDNDEQWQRSWDLGLFQQAVLVIKRAGATGLTGNELKVLFGLNRKECDKVINDVLSC